MDMMTENGTVLDPPGNKKVTNPDLYEALYKLDQGLGERFTALEGRFTCIDERINLVDGRVTEHEKSHQTASARTGGLAGLVAIVVSAIAAVLTRVRF